MFDWLFGHKCRYEHCGYEGLYVFYVCAKCGKYKFEKPDGTSPHEGNLAAYKTWINTSFVISTLRKAPIRTLYLAELKTATEIEKYPGLTLNEFEHRTGQSFYKAGKSHLVNNKELIRYVQKPVWIIERSDLAEFIKTTTPCLLIEKGNKWLEYDEVILL